MERTESVVRKMLSALPCSGYDIGVLAGNRMQRFDAISSARLLRMLPWLKYSNASGAHIYLRPTGESSYTLLDDLTAYSLAQMSNEGFAPAAVVETSPNNFQAWLRHTQPFSKELGTIAARTLAIRFHADTGAADWRRFGRAPGFTNRKPQHRNAAGLCPFARLHGHTGEVFAAAGTFRFEVLVAHGKEQDRLATLRSKNAGGSAGFARSLALSRFRASPRYIGRPAAADMAFCICACAHGWKLADIADALSREYLSRNTNARQQEAYIRRTLDKAVRWAA